ncbi:DMT family transporter [Azospirillum sp. SYSU D00513]|uniref:DMT family transporter n=1 Tax=Azospirillum sp. SYSU D00513 TaxID=2812561 RepID=UPI001A95D2D7|nr:DMT family transporter [Azospirillum sp. SYSU D00513]
MPDSPRPGPLAAYALLAVSSALFASNSLIGKAAAGSVPPAGLAFWRWAVAVLIILPFAWSGLARHRAELLRGWKRMLLLGVLAMGVCGALFYMGLEHTSATNAALIYATCPVMIVIISALWLREPVRPRQMVGIAVALAGVLAILTRGEAGLLLALSFNIGDLIVLASALSWAVYTVMLRRSPSGLPVVTSFAANALAGLVVLAPLYVWETLAGRPVVPTPANLASILGAALFASVLAFIAYQKTIGLLGAARAGAALYATPVWTSLLAWLLLGEALQGFHFVGMLLVLAGVAMATLPARGAAKPVPGKAAEHPAKA